MKKSLVESAAKMISQQTEMGEMGKITVKEGASAAKMSMNHEKEFWRHIDHHMDHFEAGQNSNVPLTAEYHSGMAQDHLKLAQLHAKMHYKKTKTKIDVGHGLDGFESKFVTHGD